MFVNRRFVLVNLMEVVYRGFFADMTEHIYSQ